MTSALIPVAISSCLLGERVRFDGGHKKAPQILEALEGQVCWVPICPEDASGLGTPRPPMDLFQTPEGLRLKTSDGAHDHTNQLLDYCRKVVTQLREQGVSGYVLKSRSPTCGVSDARIHDADQSFGDGLLVRLLRQEFQGLPLISDEKLRDQASCDRFVDAARAYFEAHYRKN